jgi:hypothetical protein
MPIFRKRPMKRQGIDKRCNNVVISIFIRIQSRDVEHRPFDFTRHSSFAIRARVQSETHDAGYVLLRKRYRLLLRDSRLQGINVAIANGTADLGEMNSAAIATADKAATA